MHHEHRCVSLHLFLLSLLESAQGEDMDLYDAQSMDRVSSVIFI